MAFHKPFKSEEPFVDPVRRVEVVVLIPRTRHEDGPATVANELLAIVIRVVDQQVIRVGAEVLSRADQELPVEPLWQEFANPLDFARRAVGIKRGARQQADVFTPNERGRPIDEPFRFVRERDVRPEVPVERIPEICGGRRFTPIELDGAMETVPTPFGADATIVHRHVTTDVAEGGRHEFVQDAVDVQENLTDHSSSLRE